MDRKFSKQLLRLADQIRDAEILTNEHVADKLLWKAYEAGAFAGDKLFQYCARRVIDFDEQPRGSGFLTELVGEFCPVQFNGFPNEGDMGAPPQKQIYEEAVRNLGRELLAKSPEDAAEYTQWSTAQPPAEWALIFKCSVDSFIRMANPKNGTIRAKKYNSRSYAVDLRDMPSPNRP